MGSKEKILSLIGLAKKAGKVVVGKDMIMAATRLDKVKLFIVAKDASTKTSKLYKDVANARNINLIEYSNKDGLGTALGKELLGCVAITDEGFAVTIEGLIKEA